MRETRFLSDIAWKCRGFSRQLLQDYARPCWTLSQSICSASHASQRYCLPPDYTQKLELPQLYSLTAKYRTLSQLHNYLLCRNKWNWASLYLIIYLDVPIWPARDVIRQTPAEPKSALHVRYHIMRPAPYSSQSGSFTALSDIQSWTWVWP